MAGEAARPRVARYDIAAALDASCTGRVDRRRNTFFPRLRMCMDTGVTQHMGTSHKLLYHKVFFYDRFCAATHTEFWQLATAAAHRALVVLSSVFIFSEGLGGGRRQ